MFDIVEKNQKLVKGIIITITATFVLWGVGGYLDLIGDDGYIAKVGDKKIYFQDINRAIDQNKPIQNQVQNQEQEKIQALFGLINRQLLLNNMEKENLVATDEELKKEIMAIPNFQESGVFNRNLYKQFLVNNFMSAEEFQNTVQQQILLTQMVDFFQNSYFLSNSFENKFISLLSRERNVANFVIDPKQFYSKIDVSDQQISEKYNQNIAQFTIPEKVKVEYIEWNNDTAMQSIKLTDAEINSYIETHKNETSTKQVDVSHILFALPPDATPKQEDKVKEEATKVLAMVNKNPNNFAKLAKEYSQDPGSAANGGDLGSFGRGVMVKPFEDVAFNLKPNQISGLVKTQYGYHIIKLNSITGGDDPVSVRNAAISQLKKQKLVKVQQDGLTQLSELTYNQPTSLLPAAKELGLKVETSAWISKGSVTGEFSDPKIQKAIFSEDVIKNHNNSEVVDLGNSTYAVYRVIESQPEKVQTLDEVKDQIINEVKSKQASAMALQLGQQNIQQLESGTLKLKFSDSENINLLSQNDSINQMIVQQIFSIPVTKLPAYTGSINELGQFVIYQINSEKIDPELKEQSKLAIHQISSENAMLDLGAYINSLRNKYKVVYKIDRLSI